MKKAVSSIAFLLVYICVHAQTAGYRYYSELGKIESGGFYNIVLKPSITAHLKADLSDLRIADSAGRWVPHIVRVPSAEIVHDAVLQNMNYAIEESDKNNSVIIIGNSAEKMSDIIFQINNSAAQRYCSLSGSNDRKEWFAINDSILPLHVASPTVTAARFVINFPAVNYHFIRLVIKNNDKDPYSINGIFSNTFISSAQFPAPVILFNPANVLQQKDSAKISRITIIQPEAYLFDALKITVTGSKYFSRTADLYLPDEGGEDPGKLIQSFTISNNSTMEFRFPVVKAKLFYLMIHNADNLPLQVTNISTGYAERLVSAYLERDKAYRLLMGNPLATAPDYDLSGLNTKLISDSMRVLSPGNIIEIKDKAAITVTSKKRNRLLLWSAIIFTLLLLLFFTMKMLREINKK